MATVSDQALQEVFSLYEKYGEGDYLGEAVSKSDHSIQCATLAEKEGYPTDVRYKHFLLISARVISGSINIVVVLPMSIHVGAGSILTCGSMGLGCLFPADRQWFIEYPHPLNLASQDITCTELNRH